MDRETILQMQFEQTIDILIMYKRENPLKDVFLSEKCINTAIKWYKNKIDNII